MEHTLGFTNFLSSADAIAQLILGILLLFSLGTWYLIFVKSFAYLSLRQRSKVFLNWFWHLPDLSAPELAQQWPTEQRSNAFSNLLRHALAAAQSYRQKTQRNPSSPSHQTGFNQSLQRVLKRALDAERSTLEFGQTFIATVAATAPFVGLLGTVWGIYHALMAISASGQATLDKGLDNLTINELV
ncbi:MAG: MotA/TolQ/ExbB proton channel family protein, partial [Pseudomonadota bacterium]